MYELKRASRITEEVQLGNEIIAIDIDIDSAMKEFNKSVNQVIRAEDVLKNLQSGGDTVDLEEVTQAYNDAVIGLLKITFGEENAGKVLEFFDNNCIEISVEVFPFIIDVIMPKMKEAAEAQKAKLAKRYKFSQGRKLGF